MQFFFRSSFLKSVYEASLWKHSKYVQKKTTGRSNKSHDNITKRVASLRRIIWKQRRDVLATENGLQLLKVKTLWSLTMCSVKEQFFLFPALVYNKKRLSTEAVTKQEPQKYPVEPNPTHQTESFENEVWKLFARAEFLVDQIFSLLRSKLSKPQTSLVGGVEIGVLLSHFAQKPSRKSAGVLDIYFTWRCCSNSGSE